MRISITAKLILFVLILSLISTYIVGKYSYERAKQALVQRTFDQLTSLRIEKANRIKDFFIQCDNDITNISRIDDTREILNLINNSFISKDDSSLKKNVLPLYNKYLKGYIEARKNYSKIIFLHRNKELNIISTTGTNKQKIFIEDSLSPVFKSILSKISSNDRVLNEDLHRIDKEAEPVLFVVKHVNQFNNSNGGTVILEIPIQVINDIMYENRMHNGLGETGETYLVGEDYLMRSTSRFQNNSVFNTTVKTEGVKDALVGITGTKQILDYRNVPVLSSFSPIDISDLKWVVLAEIDVNEAMIPINSIRSNIIYLTFIIFLLLLGVVALLTSMITAPIRSLITKTDKIAKGEFGQTLNYKANDEVGDLVKAFNKMTLQLKTQSEKLEAERRLRLTSLIDGQELERNRLSKELHDGLGPLILASKLKFERALNTKPEKSEQIIREAEEMFKKTTQELRDISNGLIPAVLTEFGIQTAIRNLTKEMSENSGIKIDVDIAIKSEIINSKFETYLFRIVQEALNNVIKHAKASEVIIQLIEKNRDLILSIRDNGIGISLSEIDEKKGNGLNNMKDRAIVLGGNFEISGEKNNGTEIRLFIKNFFHGDN